jgi:hypothetical protein
MAVSIQLSFYISWIAGRERDLSRGSALEILVQDWPLSG